MKALVLAAGEGVRLRPLTNVLPKALVPVLNVPLAEYGLFALEEAGCGEIVMNAFHLAGRVGDFIRNRRGKAALELVIEEVLLGTGGAIRNVAGEFQGGTFLVANADVLHGIDLAQALKVHHEKKALATLLLRSSGWESYGGFLVGEDGRLRGYLPKGERPPPGLRAGMFTGLHVLEPEILGHLPSEKIFCVVQKLYRPLIEKASPLFAHFVDEAPWEDLGTPARYLEANLSLLENLEVDSLLPASARKILSERGIAQRRPGILAPAPFSPSGGVRLQGPSLFGKNVQLSVGAGAGPGCIVGEGSLLEAGAQIERCVIWSGASVPPGEWKGRVFYGPGESVEAVS
ncbi:MAG: NDP-sugar synthase [Bdellovibrionota bacterium]